MAEQRARREASRDLEERAKVVVLGVGNSLRHDDAAGLEALRALQALLGGRERGERIALRAHEQETLGLIELWTDADAALIVDAVRSGAPPGVVHRVDAARGPVPERLRSSSSTHAIGVAEAIELARALGRLPAHLVLYGVEGRDFESGEGLSAPVRAAVPGLADELLREARRLARLDDLDPVE